MSVFMGNLQEKVITLLGALAIVAFVPVAVASPCCDIFSESKRALS